MPPSSALLPPPSLCSATQQPVRGSGAWPEAWGGGGITSRPKAQVHLLGGREVRESAEAKGTYITYQAYRICSN